MRPREAAPVDELGIRQILELDRAWCAYAIADLSPPWSADSKWLAYGQSLVLVYSGLSPPVLFCSGNPEELEKLLGELPGGKYWYTLRPTDFALLEQRIAESSRMRMWRMQLIDDSYRQWLGEARQLGEADVDRIEQLFADHEDRPDAYHPIQVKHGIYYGIEVDGRLASAAGTHVFDRDIGIAAIGNVFTAPEHRRRGFGIQASAAVIKHVTELGVPTTVLNVEMDNQPAIDMYHSLGFMPYCGFYEGIAVLT